MKNWEQLKYNDTFKELVDKFNINSDNSSFIDNMTGTILSNGVLYQGKETVDSKLSTITYKIIYNKIKA